MEYAGQFLIEQAKERTRNALSKVWRQADHLSGAEGLQMALSHIPMLKMQSDLGLGFADKIQFP